MEACLDGHHTWGILGQFGNVPESRGQCVFSWGYIRADRRGSLAKRNV